MVDILFDFSHLVPLQGKEQAQRPPYVQILLEGRAGCPTNKTELFSFLFMCDNYTRRERRKAKAGKGTATPTVGGR